MEVFTLELVMMALRRHSFPKKKKKDGIIMHATQTHTHTHTHIYSFCFLYNQDTYVLSLVLL